MLTAWKMGCIASPDVVPGREGNTKETTVQPEHASLWLRPETISKEERSNQQLLIHPSDAPIVK